MKFTILMLGGSKRHLPFIQYMQDKLHTVICIDKDECAPGLLCSNIGFTHSITDAEFAVEVAQTHNVDACITIADYGVRSMAHVNTALRKKTGLTRKSYDLVTNKQVAKAIFKHAGIPVPKDVAPDDAFNHFVVKPKTSTGSQDIHIMRSRWQLHNHFGGSLQQLRHDYVTEEYIQGDLVSVDAILQNGKIVLYLVQDRYLYYDCFVDSIMMSPTQQSYKTQLHLLGYAVQAAKSVGITDGPINVQFIVDKDSMPFLIELNPRMSGPYGIECHSIAMNCDWFDIMLKVALNEPYLVDGVTDRFTHNACITVGSHSHGRINGITLSDAISKEDIIWYWKTLGDHTNKMKAVKDSILHIYTEGSSYNALRDKAYHILKDTKIHTF